MAIINGTAGNDIRTGTTGSDEIYGFAGNDTLNGGGTATINDFDFLDGGAGNDTLIIRGAGTVLGGAGNDVLRFVTSGNVDIDFLNASYSTAQRGIIANLTAVARGGVAAGNNTIGYAVNDGEGGVDRLIGVHRVSDSQHGDTFFVDQTYHNSYNEAEISLTGGNDYVKVFGGAKVLVVYNSAGGAVQADLQAGFATDRVDTNLFIGYDRLIGVTDLRGSAFGDLLAGSEAANQIRGRQGNDTIFGRGGDDRLYGDNRQNDSMTGNDILDGGAGNDELGGGNGNDTLIGGLGADALNGGLGNDVYVLENGADTVSDAGGIDTATSTISRSLAVGGLTAVENLTLVNVATALNGVGNNLSNVITGNNFNNILSGGNGNDALVGNLGKDTMTGGALNDIFRFAATSHSLIGVNADVVTDFDDFGDDRIDFGAFAGTLIYKGTAAFNGIGQVNVSASGADVLVHVNLGGSFASDMDIRLANTTLASMAANDFIL